MKILKMSHRKFFFFMFTAPPLQFVDPSDRLEVRVGETARLTCFFKGSSPVASCWVYNKKEVHNLTQHSTIQTYRILLIVHIMICLSEGGGKLQVSYRVLWWKQFSGHFWSFSWRLWPLHDIRTRPQKFSPTHSDTECHW